MPDSHAERRRFKRIAFDAKTELTQGRFTWPVKLIDLSLRGMLIERPSPWLGDAKLPFIVHIHLSDAIEVRMDAELVHEEPDRLGFHCLHIGLDSIEHLRRIIELNLGDTKELERELGALIEV
ncbi:MAG: PilZ domain-containing protein [Pseudomonas sp.]|uniref:PilZ domain-containing protein n=1 Tax=Pseudomonas abieticivorans TaxID=2931382 RepID=UPI0020C15EF2|nr:PilZ domain-containing protein [Pseudomonas sp. PIA16]MDE1168226.1 PilZ domain-containing protein [Pseudomonas sp.]